MNTTTTVTVQQLIADEIETAEEGKIEATQDLYRELQAIQAHVTACIRNTEDGMQLPGGFDLSLHSRRAEEADRERIRCAQQLRQWEHLAETTPA